MSNKTQADILALLHLGWFVVAVSLFIFVVFFGRFNLLALAFVFITVLSWLIWKGCNLRIWENKFRTKYDPTSAYEGTYLRHYLNKILGVKVSDTIVRVGIYIFLGILLLFSVVNL